MPKILSDRGEKQAEANWLDAHEGDEVRVCGWGKTKQAGQAQYPDELHCVDVQLIAHSECNAPAAYDGIVYDGQFCAGIANEGGKGWGSEHVRDT